MRLIKIGPLSIAILCLGAIIQCGPADDGSDDAPSVAPEVTMEGIFEFQDPDGYCTGAERFGDASLGCVKDVQVTKFSDGSGFVLYGLGLGLMWEGGFYLAPNTTTWTKTKHFGNGGTHQVYEFSGDLSLSVPTLSVKFDNNADLVDTATKSFTLIEQ